MLNLRIIISFLVSLMIVSIILWGGYLFGIEQTVKKESAKSTEVKKMAPLFELNDGYLYSKPVIKQIKLTGLAIFASYPKNYKRDKDKQPEWCAFVKYRDNHKIDQQYNTRDFRSLNSLLLHIHSFLLLRTSGD